MRVGFDRAEIVDRDDLEILTAGFNDVSQDVASNASETVDRHARRHMLKLPRAALSGRGGRLSRLVRAKSADGTGRAGE